jgi:queuine tRNA-ribosyltransferase
MPVGTRAGVNCVTSQELETLGAEIILGGNTYHMLVAPQMPVLQNAGGMHPFMNWQKPMLTDSGGFQIFSLSKNSEICTIDEEGAHFKIPGSSNVIHMSPEVSLQTQKIIGADIIMAFDQCTPGDVSFEKAKAIMERTHRWLRESREYQHKHPDSVYGNRQGLFGIIQGGTYQELREISTQVVVDLDFDGIAIGGESIGFDMEKTKEIIAWVRPMLPEKKTRYTMGVGLNPQNLLDVIREGIDIFDCVAPTRNARHGALYAGEFVYEKDWISFKSERKNGCLQIKRQEFASDESPIMK